MNRTLEFSVLPIHMYINKNIYIYKQEKKTHFLKSTNIFHLFRYFLNVSGKNGFDSNKYNQKLLHF